MESSSDGNEVHLQPETILSAVADAEEKFWSKGGMTDELEESSHTEDGELGNVILQHGRLTKRIHNYFTNLEQRKCCLLLAGCKQTFRSVRLVRSDGRDSGIEEGAMMKSSTGNTETVSCLSAEDFQVFQHALRCAAFPVLGAPDPPSGSSPSPRSTPATGVIQKRPDLHNALILARGTVTPHSAGDSGVEEQDDAMVPAETLCELLRRAFRLTTEKFNQYEDIVAAQLEKKSPQKVLVEELVRQLMALENNANAFYSPSTFLNRLGYDRWQQKERTHITELIQKFWHFSLPQTGQSSGRSSFSKHEQYNRLMEKLIQYEFPYRQENENSMTFTPPTSPLSSASLRLLKEFGLRYGVGDQYRKTVYLHYLATNFEPTLWFIQHVSTSLTSIMESMPSKRSFLTIVKEEFSMLERSLHLLDVKASVALGKMKTLFSCNQPADGIESLIELLSITLQSKSYLLMQSEERLSFKLQKIIQNTFPVIYERHKLVAKDELRQNKWAVELNPRLLNMLIGHIRDEVNDYKMNYQHTFFRYFNITLEAAQEFYKLLMSDLEELHRQTQDDMNNMDIDLLMLSLAYRLSQLDKDWTSYITPQMQSWRTILLQEAQHWTIVMKVHMHDFVTEVVGQDKYENCQLIWLGSLHQSSSQGTSHRSHSASIKSLTPSVNSAFSTLSSPHSTPGPKQMPGFVPSHPPVIQESDEELAPKQSGKDKPAFVPLDDTRLTLSEKLCQEEKRPSSDPVNVSHSSVLSGSYIGDMASSLGHYEHDHFLTFAQVRHSSSLPNMNNVTNGRFLEENNKLNSEACDKNVEGCANGKDQNSLVTDTNSSGNIDSKEIIGHEESQEIQNYMANPVTMTTELEDSDDSHTLTDDSLSQDEEFKFPPIQEVDSVSTSPVVISHCEPVTVSDTFTNKISVLRPKPKPSYHHSSSNQKSTSPAAQKRKSKDVPNETRQPQETRSHNPASISTSDGSSVIADVNLKESFTESVISNISFPSPQKHSKAVLPISSSIVDMIVIFQRLVAIGKTLCKTFSPVFRASSLDPFNPVTSSSEEEMHYQPLDYSCNQKLYDGFLNCLCSTVCVYADNMLCMDLCGTSTSTASKLAGPRLVEYLQTQQRSGLIWGCRHNRLETRSCFEYMNKKTNLLCDRHEPITRGMCTRINNVMSVLTFLELYHRRLGNVFGVYGDWSLKKKHDFNMSLNSLETLRSEFIVLENYGYDPSGDKRDVFETVSQKFSEAEANNGSKTSVVVSSPIDSYKSHLMAVLRAQSRLMAYRLNLFVCDALPLLLALKAANMTLGKALKPITDFLTSYITALKSWLYMDSFRRVLECLWIFIVQDFELELYKLERLEDSTESIGQLLLQAIAHLLKFMNSQHESLRKELLLEQADDVSFRLSLYAMPSLHLISVYKGLVKESHETDVTSIDTQYQSVILVRERLRHDLQKLRKGFSGNDLVRWILDNQQLFMNFDPALSEGSMRFTQEIAYHVAQRLLDWGLIADVEGESSRGHSPTFSLSFEFPDLTQIPGYNFPERPFSRQSDDSTPEATPRATPKPNLRDSIRAASRHSLMKLSTPGLKQLDRSIDKSKSLTSNRSGRSSKYERSERSIRRKQNSESSKEVSMEESRRGNSDHGVVEIHTQQNQSITEIPVVVMETPSHVNTGNNFEKENANCNGGNLGHGVSKLDSMDQIKTNISEEISHFNVDTGQECKTGHNYGKMDNSKGELKHSTEADNNASAAVNNAHCSFERLESASSSKEIESTFNPTSKLENILPESDQETSFYGNDFDPFLPRGTPVSFSSGISCSSHSILFMGTSDHFYFVCPQVGGELETTLKNYEQFQLVEECYQKRIMPEYILRILQSRRKNDANARNFVRNLPYDIIQTLTEADDDVSSCVSS